MTRSKTKERRLPVLVALACCSCASPDAGAPRDVAADPADELVEGIVYSALRPPNYDIYLLEPGGASATPLTADPALDYNAVFSPDGSWIVFTSERTGQPDLWALRLASTPAEPPVRLTRHEALDDAASFSPDGRSLAFVSTRDGDADVFVMRFAPSDPSAEQGATNLTRRPGGEFNPVFSPDGDRIAYSRQDALWPRLGPGVPVMESHAAELYVMNADGSDVRRLTEGGPGLRAGGVEWGAVSGSPGWSPGGDALYYHRVAHTGSGIRRLGLDGSGDTLVTGDGLSPSAGPEGRVFFSLPQRREGLDAFDALKTGRIASIGADGSDLRMEDDAARAYFAPDVDLASGRVVAHGETGTDGLVGDLGEGFVFAPPGAAASVRLPDRTLEMRGVRGLFPALTPDGHVLSTVFELATDSGVPLRRSTVAGAELRALFSPESAVAWGASVDRVRGRVVVAVGPPFAPGEAEVDIWELALDGTSAVNLTAGVPGNDALPHVSSGGDRIAFRGGGDGTGWVYVMERDGSERRRVTADEANETMPALSPDGEWVVFSTRKAGGYKLWLQRLDGTGGRFLEPDRLDVPDSSLHARFSPDGEWIVFTSDRGGMNDEWPLTFVPQPYGDLWALPVSGGPAVRLIHNKWEDGPNDWGLLSVPRAGNGDRPGPPGP